jgi:hypothetical protein
MLPVWFVAATVLLSHVLELSQVSMGLLYALLRLPRGGYLPPARPPPLPRPPPGPRVDPPGLPLRSRWKSERPPPSSRLRSFSCFSRPRQPRLSLCRPCKRGGPFLLRGLSLSLPFPVPTPPLGWISLHSSPPAFSSALSCLLADACRLFFFLTLVSHSP